MASVPPSGAGPAGFPRSVPCLFRWHKRRAGRRLRLDERFHAFGRRGRRDPSGRRDAAAAWADGRRPRRARGVLHRALGPELLPALSRRTYGRPGARRALRRPGLARSWRPRRRSRGRDRRRGGVHAAARRAERRGGVRGRGRASGARGRHPAPGAARPASLCGRDRALRRPGAARELRDARGLQGRGLRHRARARPRRDRGRVSDRRDGDVPGACGRARSPRRDRLAAAVLRAALAGGRRRIAPARVDRWRAVSQCPRRRLRGRGLPGQPRRRARRRRPWLPIARGAARGRRSRRDLPPRTARPRSGRGGARARDQGAVRDLVRLRRDRRGGRRAAGSTPGARPRARRTAGRPELPRDRDPAARAQRHLRPEAAPAGADRVLLPERRARPGAAREGVRAPPRLLRVRLDREQGRRLLERPARVVGGRSRQRGRAALPRVVRQPGQVQPARAARGAAQADPRAQGGDDRRRARGPPARTRPRSRARTPRSTRSSTRRACSARALSRSSSMPRRCSRASRSRVGAASA